jgi:FkbM family methyltransferase
MKHVHGWWFPDHEKHLPEWMAHPKNSMVLNGKRAYQGKKQGAAMRHCKNFRVAVDVGGHVGLWSWNLAHQFNEVIAFEPVAAHRECFEKNLAGLDNVTLRPLVLGVTSGRVSIQTEKGSSGNSQVCSGTDVEMVTLDSLAIPKVDFMKIDTEGYEENVLRGAEQTIRRCRPTIIVEQKRDMSTRFGLKPLGAVEFLQSLGYKVVEEISGDYILVPAK